MRAWLLLLGLMLLSGCVSQQQQTEFNPDGSGVYEIRIGFSQQMLDFAMMGSSGVSDDALDDALLELGSIANGLPTEWQASSENWKSDDGKYRGTLIRMQFRDAAMLRDQLTNSDLNELYSLVRFEDVEVIQDGRQVRIRATIKNGENSMFDSEESSDLLGSGLIASPTTSWTIRFPERIDSWSEREIASVSEDKKTLTYDFPYPLTRDYQLEIVGVLSPTVPQWALWVVGGLVGVGLILVGVGFVLSRRKPTSRYQPYDPATAGPSTAYPAASQTTPLAPYAPKPDEYQPSDSVAPYMPKPAEYQPSDSVAPYAPKPASYQPNDSNEQPTSFGSTPAEYGGRTPTRSLGMWQDPNDKT
ncbi:hypothetical protein ACP8Y2_16160 [Herpetosiphon llansteffanensis]